MNYPELKSDFLLITENTFPTEFVETLLINKLKDCKISFDLQIIDRAMNYSRGEWISGSSLINLYISDSLITQHYKNKTEDLKVFLAQFKEFIQPIAKITNLIDKELKTSRPYAAFSAFYKSKDGFIFRFIFKIEGDESVYIDALNSAFNLILDYNSDDENEIQKSIRETYSQKSKIKYLLHINKKWIVLNPLIEVCKELNNDYKKDKDPRIKKPNVILHKDDFRKHFILDDDWILTSDKLETLMIKPNDVSLYSSISDKNLVMAKKFYSERITPRYKHFNGRFPSSEIQTQYYDYFELIITALIFAYTSLEAFANICIPDDYEYVTEKENGIKITYSKFAIEKKLSLRDKFKNVLRSILNTSDPAQEPWWSNFINLESIRDEIIHTKQSKSEDRYSQLLSYSIFKTIQCHKDIIKYYGHYISENHKDLLNEFPYNFEHDEFYPGFTDDKGYERSYKTLYGIPD